MNKMARILRLIIISIFLPTGGLLVGLFSLPYEQLKLLGDSISRNGTLRSLTPTFYENFHVPLVILGVGLGVAAVILLIMKRPGLNFIESSLLWLGDFWKRLWSDWKTLLVDSRQALPPRRDVWILTGITLAAFLIRWVLIVRPMGHDESYTFITFADLPFRYLVADYHFPNNHVFHTILVRLCYLIIGIQPWSIRLPAFTAGLLLVPLTYFPARQLFNRPAALLAAALTASAQLLIDYSTLARGYSLVVFFTLLVFGLGIYTSRKKNLAAWGLMILFSTLGFYTVPIMVISIGVILTWIGLSWLWGDIDPAYQKWGIIKYLILCGATSIAAGLILYSPIFFHQGIGVFIDNAYVAPVSWSNFPEAFQLQLTQTWRDFFQETPSVITASILIPTVIFSLIFHRKISDRKIPILAAIVLFLAVDLVIQRPQPASRSWVMLQPIIFMIISAGMLAPFQWLDRVHPMRFNLTAGVIGLLFVALLVGNGLRSGKIYEDTAGDKGMGDVEKTVLYMQGQLKGTDIFVVASPDDAPFWYYFRLHNVSGYYIYGVKVRSFDRAFVPIDHTADNVGGHDQNSLVKTIHDRGPDFWFINFQSDQIVKTIGTIDIHLLYPIKSALISQYGQ